MTNQATPFTDFITGTNGPDYIDALEGHDYVFGEGGNDLLYGSGGSDTVSGDTGNDLVSGGEGDDQLLGYHGDDQLYGGTGDDSLNGGTGKDQLFGSTGADSFYFDKADSGDVNAGQADMIYDFSDEDQIYLIGGDYTYAGNTDGPADGQYGIWQQAAQGADYIVTWNAFNDDGYHDLAVKGADPHGDIVFA
jgi:Ca2+-binding RTX toxin-like protein